MNCFSSLQYCAPSDRGRRFRILVGLIAAATVGCDAPASEDGRSGRDRARLYDVAYRLAIDPGTQTVAVSLMLSQPDDFLREMRFDTHGSRVQDVRGDGVVDAINGEIVWTPPERGGELSWKVSVPHKRGDGYDAWLGESWGIFRAEDVIPRAATRTLKGAESRTTLRFVLPAGWSAVTEYAERNGAFQVQRPERRFGQPAGWIAVGDLGVRRERIAGVRVAVAAPVDQGVRRMDMLAMANWVLPELVRLLPTPPSRITIVSAAAPMWRGGLSAPQSIFVHADRPLISENGTSTLVHEFLHVGLSFPAVRGYDWIVEGLAEYYTLELLRRSGSITERRFERSLKSLGDWAQDADSLCRSVSSGASTALAVVTLLELDRELDARSDGERSLDDVLFDLASRNRPVDLDALADSVEGLIGEVPDLLHSNRLPGCRTLAGDDGN